jgi:catechol 2,3-dioxygenase-like lactoylglutathione lyase family enzyme
MRVNALDHVNILTDDVERTARFYAEVLGLDPRLAAGQLAPALGRWLYDQNGQPIIHVVKRDFLVKNEHENALGSTGAIHHVALRCSGKTEMVERLRKLDIEFRVNDVPAVGISQIFVRDPQGVLLELNFRGE